MVAAIHIANSEAAKLSWLNSSLSYLGVLMFQLYEFGWDSYPYQNFWMSSSLDCSESCPNHCLNILVSHSSTFCYQQKSATICLGQPFHPCLWPSRRHLMPTKRKKGWRRDISNRFKVKVPQTWGMCVLDLSCHTLCLSVGNFFWGDMHFISSYTKR